MAFLRYMFHRSGRWTRPHQEGSTLSPKENRPRSSKDQLHTSAAAQSTQETPSKSSLDDHQLGREWETRCGSRDRGDDFRSTSDSAAFLTDMDDLQASSDIEPESPLSSDVVYSRDHSAPTTEERQDGLPVYNDVSGRVVVSPDGQPQFLTPQERAERQVLLQRAVQERMLGLPRQTNFSWAPVTSPTRPEDEPLPRYEAGRMDDGSFRIL